MTRFIAVVWNQTHSIFEVCLLESKRSVSLYKVSSVRMHSMCAWCDAIGHDWSLPSLGVPDGDILTFILPLNDWRTSVKRNFLLICPPFPRRTVDVG